MWNVVCVCENGVKKLDVDFEIGGDKFWDRVFYVIKFIIIIKVWKCVLNGIFLLEDEDCSIVFVLIYMKLNYGGGFINLCKCEKEVKILCE